MRPSAWRPATIVVIETLLLLPSFPGLEAGARGNTKEIILTNKFTLSRDKVSFRNNINSI